MRRDGAFWRGDEKAASHAEMHDPLSGWFACIANQRAAARCTQLANDVFSGAMHSENGAAHKPGGLPLRRRFEWFAVRTERRFGNAVSAHACMHAAGYGFDFGQFRHRSILSCREAFPDAGPRAQPQNFVAFVLE
jgi:hypothetical protein